MTSKAKLKTLILNIFKQKPPVKFSMLPGTHPISSHNSRAPSISRFNILVYLLVSTNFKNISQIGSFPQVGVKKKHIWNHHRVVPWTKNLGLSFVSMDPFIFELTHFSTWLTSVVPKKRSQSNIDQSSYLNLFESFWQFLFVALVLPSPFKPIHPWSLTWNLKISPWKSRIPLWFRHVSPSFSVQTSKSPILDLKSPNGGGFV